MNQVLMKRLETFLFREDNSSLVGKPAKQEQIKLAEQQLNIRFHEDYIQFISTFGGAYAGLAVHAFENGSSIGNETVVELTLSFRESAGEAPYAELLNEGYVISIDGSGDPVVINKAGEVWTCYHDTGESERLAQSFDLFIEEIFAEW